MWVRGLKPYSTGLYSTDFVSHPMWVRGLKLAYKFLSCPLSLSHPMWVRGLKLTKKLKVTRIRRRTPCGCVD